MVSLSDASAVVCSVDSAVEAGVAVLSAALEEAVLPPQAARLRAIVPARNREAIFFILFSSFR